MTMDNPVTPKTTDMTPRVLNPKDNIITPITSITIKSKLPFFIVLTILFFIIKLIESSTL